jgi:hypothetical protein
VTLDQIHAAIPLPWKAERTYDPSGWAHRVVCRDGKPHDTHQVYKDQGAALACLQAVAPYALDYVLRAAEKGGVEAMAIAERYRKMIAGLGE